MLHHNDYHYRFYHYLGNPDDSFVHDITAVLAGTASTLPEAAGKAFRNWPTISKSLRDLFKRGPREAITAPEAILARMALTEAGKGGYPESVADLVRKRAEEMLAGCEAHSGRPVVAVLAESRRLVNEMDAFVALFDAKEGEGVGISADDAEQQVRGFLEHCRKLNRELSAIPSRLRDEGIGAGA